VRYYRKKVYTKDRPIAIPAKMKAILIQTFRAIVSLSEAFKKSWMAIPRKITAMATKTVARNEGVCMGISL
jgi:hypothetical protein